MSRETKLKLGRNRDDIKRNSNATFPVIEKVQYHIVRLQKMIPCLSVQSQERIKTAPSQVRHVLNGSERGELHVPHFKQNSSNFIYSMIWGKKKFWSLIKFKNNYFSLMLHFYR